MWLDGFTICDSSLSKPKINAILHQFNDSQGHSYQRHFQIGSRLHFCESMGSTTAKAMFGMISYWLFRARVNKSSVNKYSYGMIVKQKWIDKPFLWFTIASFP